MERKIYAVSEINQLIKSVLDNIPQFGNLCIRGEISNYKFYPSSGHHYFTLKDAEGAIKCVMFRGQATRLRFRPENGMKVLAAGRITVFPRDGAYQLYCDSLTPDGIGDLHVAFEQLKEKLWREGMFSDEHKKPLPEYPERIGIVTSSSGAAVHDMIRILRRRYPLAKVKLLPVRVQGTEAPPEIVSAIRYANRYRVADVLIVGRGGGSLEDLWAFNDERVARAIYESEIPVISAVGHEPDVTIADFVADVRAATPSHAAEIAVPDQTELLAWIRGMQFQMIRAQNTRLKFLGSRLEALSKKRVMTDPMAFIQDKQMILGHIQKDLYHAAAASLRLPGSRLAALAASLDAMSPLKVLGRGFSLLENESGEIVRFVEDVTPGESISATLADGKVLCTVDKCVKTKKRGKN